MKGRWIDSEGLMRRHISTSGRCSDHGENGEEHGGARAPRGRGEVVAEIYGTE
jgi:hypothetical protein